MHYQNYKTRSNHISYKGFLKNRGIGSITDRIRILSKRKQDSDPTLIKTSPSVFFLYIYCKMIVEKDKSLLITPLFSRNRRIWGYKDFGAKP